MSVVNHLELVNLLTSRNPANGEIFVAHLVAARLDTVAEILPQWSAYPEIARLAAAEIRRHADPTKAARDAEMASRGLRSAHPHKSLFIPNRGATGRLPGDPIRALLLIVLLNSRELAKPNPARDLPRFVLDLWDTDRLGIETAHFCQYLQSPTKANLGLARSALLALTRRPDWATKATADALTRLLDSADRILATNRKDFEERQTSIASRRSLLQEELGGFGQNARLKGRDGDFRIGVSSPTQEVVARRVQVADLRRSGWLYERSLNPGGDHCLSDVEAAAVACVLTPLAVGNRGTPLEQVAAIAELLSLCTSIGIRDSLDLLRSALSEAQPASQSLPFALRIIGNIWCVVHHYPGDQPAEVRTELLSGSSTLEVVRPLPVELQSAIARLKSLEVSLSHATFAECRRRLINVLASASPRWSDGRSRWWFPKFTFSGTADPTAAQMLCGSSLGQSHAPLAYRIFQSVEVRRLWDKAIEHLGLSPTYVPQREEWVGAPICLIKDEAIQSLVQSYVSGTRQMLEDSDELGFHDALTIYTARLFIATTQHRGNDNLGLLHLSWFSGDGFGAMVDKPSDLGPGIRATVMTRLLARQLQVLSGYRRWLLAQPHLNIDESARALLKSDKLFWLINKNDGLARPLVTSDIRPPVETGIPTNVYRSRTRMALTSAGVWPRLIYAQMGHVYNGCAPFDEHSLEPLASALEPVRDVVDLLLTHDGWELITHAPSAENCDGAWPEIPEFSVAALRSVAESSEDSENPRSTPHKVTLSDRTLLRALVNEITASTASVSNAQINVTEEMCAAWSQTVVDRLTEFPHLIEPAFAALKQRVHKLRRAGLWTGYIPGSALRQDTMHPAISVRHVAAYHLVSSARYAALNSPAPDHRNELLARWARLSLLLICETIVHSSDQLMEVLSLVEIDGAAAASRGFLEIRYHGEPRAVALSREISHLVHGLRGQAAPNISRLRNAVKGLLGDASKLKTTIPELIKTAHLSARITKPGVLWSALDRMDPGTLTLKRSVDWVEERIGGATAPTNQPQADDTVSTRYVRLVPRGDKRHAQYKALRLDLYKYREPDADEQGVEPQRFANAKRRIEETCADPDIDELVYLLGRFAGSFMSDGRARRRISVAYAGMTNIGLRLINHLQGGQITAMDEEGLVFLYNSILSGIHERRRPEISSSLRRFHRLHADVLADINWSAVIGGSSDPHAATTSVVTSRESDAALTILSARKKQFYISDRDAENEGRIVRGTSKLGLRLAEITHACQMDYWRFSGRDYLYVRNGDLGLVKSPSSRRLLSVDPPFFAGDLPAGHSTSITALVDVDRKDSVLADQIEEVRDLTRQLTGEDDRLMHAGRHGTVNRLISEISQYPGDSDQYFGDMKATAEVGHRDIGTKYDYYWHLQHLQAVPLGTALNSSQLSNLTGRTPVAIRVEKSRRAASAVVSTHPPSTVEQRNIEFTSSLVPIRNRAESIEERFSRGSSFLGALLGGTGVLEGLRTTGLSNLDAKAILTEIHRFAVRRRVLILDDGLWRTIFPAIGLVAPSITLRCRAIVLSPSSLKRLRKVTLTCLPQDQDEVMELLLTPESERSDRDKEVLEQSRSHFKAGLGRKHHRRHRSASPRAATVQRLDDDLLLVSLFLRKALGKADLGSPAAGESGRSEEFRQ